MTEKAKILLVDDRPENLVALEAILGSLGLTGPWAGSGPTGTPSRRATLRRWAAR